VARGVGPEFKPQCHKKRNELSKCDFQLLVFKKNALRASYKKPKCHKAGIMGIGKIFQFFISIIMHIFTTKKFIG
jgi:hypothetical protein